MLKSVLYVLGPGARQRMRRRLRRTLRRSQDCRKTQERTLRKLLRINADSDFSRDHGLHRVRSVAEFQRSLPVADYQRAAPYIERMKQGDLSALLGRRNTLLMFALTSGTTSDSKFIPITHRFLRDYRRGWQDWGIRAFDAHRGLFYRRIFQVCSDHDRIRTASGVPCGNISGLVQRIQNSLVRSLYAVSGDVLKVSDPAAKAYLALRQGVACRDLGLITTANPSTVLQMFRQLSICGEALVRDLHDGTENYLAEGQVPPALRRRKDPRRARELDLLLQRDGKLAPRAVWPALELLAVWTGGSAAAYLPQLKKFTGDLPIRDHGLHASEGRMTIPLEDHTSSGLLDIQSHFFEFIPEAEYESSQPTVLQAHELQPGESYYILLTTSSGLYRYDIQDVVECTGFYATTPLLRFLHKGARIANLTGEKLTESQVVQAVSRAARKLNSSISEFTVAPRWDDPPKYVLLGAESSAACPRRMAAAIDAELCALNVEYVEKRNSGRLDPLIVQWMPEKIWERFVRERQLARDGVVEGYKHLFLAPQLNFLPEFEATYLNLNCAEPAEVVESHSTPAAVPG